MTDLCVQRRHMSNSVTSSKQNLIQVFVRNMLRYRRPLLSVKRNTDQAMVCCQSAIWATSLGRSSSVRETVAEAPLLGIRSNFSTWFQVAVLVQKFSHHTFQSCHLCLLLVLFFDTTCLASSWGLACKLLVQHPTSCPVWYLSRTSRGLQSISSCSLLTSALEISFK